MQHTVAEAIIIVVVAAIAFIYRIKIGRFIADRYFQRKVRIAIMAQDKIRASMESALLADSDSSYSYC